MGVSSHDQWVLLSFFLVPLENVCRCFALPESEQLPDLVIVGDGVLDPCCLFLGENALYNAAVLKPAPFVVGPVPGIGVVRATTVGTTADLCPLTQGS